QRYGGDPRYIHVTPYTSRHTQSTPYAGQRMCVTRSRSRSRPCERAFAFNESDDLVQPLPLLDRPHHKGALPAHALGVFSHDLKGGTDMRREIRLVDDEQVRFRDARPALARYLLAARHVDDV